MINCKMKKFSMGKTSFNQVVVIFTRFNAKSP